MQQLSVADTTLLNLETPSSTGHVSSVAILDPSTCPQTFCFERLRDRLMARLPAVPMFRRRLWEVPLGLDRPYWVEDADFDLDYHLRHIAVPPPGDRQSMADLIARIHERPLDRRRPLWEMYVIEGLAGGQVAILSKIHHAAIDGVTGQEVLAALVDTEPDAPAVIVPDTWRAEEPPRDRDLLIRTGVRSMLSPYLMFLRGLRLARDLPAVGGIFGNALLFLGRAGSAEELIDHPDISAPRTHFNRSIGPHRRWAFVSVDLSLAKDIRRRAQRTLPEVSVTDVVLTVCAGALRQWLDAHHDLPDRSLAALVPVSVATRRADGTVEHRVSGTIVALGTELTDPLERLTVVTESMSIVREHQAVPARTLRTFGELTPPSISALAARLVARTGLAERFHPPFNLVIANVPGPDLPLYAAGARILAHYPIASILDGVGLNISVTSMAGRLDFGFVADRDLVPDLWELADLVDVSFDELAHAVSRRRRGGAPVAS